MFEKNPPTLVQNQMLDFSQTTYDSSKEALKKFAELSHVYGAKEDGMQILEHMVQCKENLNEFVFKYSMYLGQETINAAKAAEAELKKAVHNLATFLKQLED